MNKVFRLQSVSGMADADLGEFGLQLLTTAGEFGLHLGWVLHLAVPCQDLLIVCHHLFVMGLDILYGSLDIVWEKAEQARNLIVAPALVYVIHHVIDGNAGSLNFWPAPTIDNLRAHNLLS